MKVQRLTVETMEENLNKNCKKCWYYYNTNCTQDNDLIENNLSEIICNGFSSIEYNTDTSAEYPNDLG